MEENKTLENESTNSTPQKENFFKKNFKFEEGSFSKKNLIITCVVLVLSLVITILTGITYQKFKKYQTWFDTSKVTYTAHLGDYSPKLTGVGADTEIYVIAGPDAPVTSEGIGDITNCPSMLILGGTHPNEPSGQLTATLFLENVKVESNTVLFVITETNKSAYTYSYPQEASPMYYNLQTKTGANRTFKFGARATNNTDQWPNPDIYVTALGNKLSSSDTRNLNRSYPGVINGTYSERIAYGITQMVIKHDIKVVIDLHEASPEYVTINALVYHQEAASIAGGITTMKDFDVPISINESPTNLHGLTHREIGDATNALVFLAETSNASQGKIRGAFKESLITYTEEDKFYEKAKELTENGKQILYGYPIEISERVARHSFTILELILNYNRSVTRSSGFSSVTDVNRRQFLKDCGKLNISLPLIDEIPAADQAQYDDYLDQEEQFKRQVYDVLVDYKVGYFLSDPE